MNFMVWVSLMAGSDKSYPSWHLYLVWGIFSLHFLCWYNSFEGYYHSNFWKFLSKFAVTFCVEAMFTLVPYISPFLCCLKHTGTSLKSNSFSLMKSFVCHIEMTDLRRMKKILSVTVGKHVSSFYWWWNPVDVHEVNSTACVKSCHK
jgi:hypothetical protein